MTSSLLLLAIAFFGTHAFGLTITGDYGKSIQAEVDSHDDVKPGMKFKVVDKNGKTTATAVVDSVKGSIAWLAVTSGRAQVTGQLIPDVEPNAAAAAVPEPKATLSSPPPTTTAPTVEEKYEFGREEFEYEAPKPKVRKKRAKPQWRGIVGLDSFTFRGSGAAGAGRKIGFILGARIEFPWKKNLTWETGLQYYQAGATYGSRDLNLNYLGAPATVNWKLAPYWHAKGGLLLSYLVNHSGTGAPSDKTDYATVLGTRYSWRSGKHRYSADFEYTYGLKRFDSGGSYISNTGALFLFGMGW
jgi:hypothetical protein